jgi:hypothetical protein
MIEMNGPYKYEQNVVAVLQFRAKGSLAVGHYL